MTQDNITWPAIEDDWGNETLPMSLDVTPPLTVDELKSLVTQRHPHIGKVIDLLWGSKEMDIQFGQWGIDDRGGRRGFNQVVLDSLVQLSLIHQNLFKFTTTEKVLRRKNIWPDGDDALS